MRQELLYVDGKWKSSATNKWLDVTNPFNGEVVGRMAYGSREDARLAIEAAHRAGPAWAALTAKARWEVMTKAGGLVRERAKDLARLVTLENGKPMAQSLAEVNQSADNLTWFAEEGRRAYGRMIPSADATKRWLVIRHPLGVTAAISPWNFPILLQARKVAPALAAGCTVVMKPARKTPLVAVEFLKCLIDAGVPAGAANLVTGPAEEIADEFLCNPLCKKITFTGSTEVGRDLMRKGSDQIKRLSLELGGHAPLIVFADADVEKASVMAANGKFRNAGQTCISPNRFYVHEAIYDKFMAAFVGVAGRMKVGNGLEEGVDLGPMIDEAGFKKAMAHIEDAVSKGAKVLCGGKPLTGPGFDKGLFIAPTVLANVTRDMLCMREETFGPVAPVAKFRTDDEAIAEANNTIFGLASYAFTQSLKTLMYAAERLETGIIGINDTVPAVAECPFGGMKQSGVGREGGHEGLDAFLETKFVSVVL